MSKARLTDEDWSTYSSAASSKTKEETFTRESMKSTSDHRTSFDPKTIPVREARDSDVNPSSTPIIIGFDVTGSMGEIPYYFVKEGLGKLMKEIYDRKPVSDPQIMCAAIGDATCDKAPLQVSQFESDIRIAKQLEEFYLEGGGGPNEGESYNLPWYFAATRTSTDNFEKRGKKGLLFTIGDEPPLLTLTKRQIQKFIGDQVDHDLTSTEILEMVRRQYDVYHIIVEQGQGFGHHGEEAVVGGWNKLLGQGHVLRLRDYTKLSEVVISAIQHNAGVDYDTIVKSWSGDTSLVVASALPTVPVRRTAASPRTGVRRLAAPKVS